MKDSNNRPVNRGTWDPFARKGGTERTEGHLLQLHLQGLWGIPGHGLAQLGQQLPMPASPHLVLFHSLPVLGWGPQLGPGAHWTQSLQREGPQISLSLALPTL